jgi:thiol:disulfide interchange protein
MTDVSQQKASVEALFDSDPRDFLAGDYDERREREIAAQIEAEQRAKGGAPTELFLFMLAPLALIALPILLLFALKSNPAPSASSTGGTVTTSQSISGSPIAWQTSLDAAQEMARQSGKSIMVDFYADWCAPCKDMEASTWPDASVAQEAQNFISVKINADSESALQQRYNITGLPTILFLNADGSEKGRAIGGHSPQDILPLMQQYR